MNKNRIKSSISQRIIIFLFVGLSLAAGYLYIRSKRLSGDDSNLIDTNVLEANEGEVVWENYVNSKYSFSFDRPKLLKVREIEDSGKYLIFIRLEENQYTLAKGIGVGVADLSLSDQVEELKKELEGEFEVELVSEKGIRVDGFEAIVIVYEPRDKSVLEARSFLVVNNGEYSVSVSTVPGQMDRIISSFKFL